MEILGVYISEKIYLPVIIVLVSFILYKIVNAVLNTKIKLRSNLTKHEQRSRETVTLLIKNTAKIIIIIFAILAILQVFGVNTSALVAGVGAVSLVIGLAFQDVLKDYLVGITIVMESQFAIGEIVEINGFKGEVVSLTLKSTRLKALSGEVKIIANRNISEVINYSLGYVNIKVIVSVSYEDDIKKVEKVLNDLFNRLNGSISEFKSDITISGINELSSSSVDFLVCVKASAKDEFKVRTLLLKEIKLEFDKNNIKIPYPQVEVHYEK